MDPLSALGVVSALVQTLQLTYRVVSKLAIASKSTQKVADDLQDFRFEVYALEKKLYAIKQWDYCQCTQGLHADGTFLRQPRFDSGTLRERLADTFKNARISTQHSNTARKTASLAHPMSTWGHFSISDPDCLSGRHSSSNRGFTSDQNDLDSHARFIHLDTEFTVGTLALVKQRVPIKNVGLPEGDIHLWIPWTLVIDALDEHWHVEPLQIIYVFTYSVILAACGLTHEWKILRLMQRYETGKERFATKIREAILNLRRPQSALTRVVRRVRRALSTPLSWQTAFFSPILLAPSVGAIGLDQPTRIQITALSYDYWFKVLHAVRTNIPSLLVDPHSKQSSEIPSTSDPQTLLLACFICTGLLALITQARRKDIYQTYIIALCALIATTIGVMYKVDSRAFIFGYLFCGCAIGAGGSAIFHYVKNAFANESEPESSCGLRVQHRQGHETKLAMDHHNGHDNKLAIGYHNGHHNH
ncbi:MAG: hypothetical protein Q9180_005801 [Flavoplaca navasiana]